MKSVDFVFVILTYINSNDLKEFFESIRFLNLNAASVVVDAYHDDESSKKIKQISKDNNADYIKIENKGYSYGNNYGIKYANDKYRYKYIIISNPDIIIKKMDLKDFIGMDNAVVAPKILNLKGKMQNPMFVSKNIFAQKLVYKGLKKEKKFLFFCGILINKINRYVFLKFKNKKKESIYQAHGSFVIFSSNVIKKLKIIYDENIFLFAEESYLAIKLSQNNIKTIYNPNIEIFHKEDGSMGFRNDINEQMKKSNIYVFEKYYGF